MPNSPRLKIGLDYHGVISRHQKYFADFAAEAVKRGHQIYIITGGPKYAIAQKLRQLHLPYTEIFAIYDFYKNSRYMEYQPNGDWHIPDELWDKAKGEYCLAQKINIHIDDSKKYIRWFSTPYCCFSSLSQNCVLENGAQIDFSQPAAAALDDIEAVMACCG